MIVLDTNVVSEFMKPVPVKKVMDWVASKAATSLYITSITQAEILHGILLLPAGKRRKAIELAAEAMFEEDFDGRILPFGSDAAFLYAQIAADRRKRGQPISHLDAQIAAISRASGATVGTRNVADFIHCGIEVVNPWD